MNDLKENNSFIFKSLDNTQHKKIMVVIEIGMIILTLLALVLDLVVSQQSIEKYLPFFIAIMSMIFSVILYTFIIFYDYYESRKERYFAAAVGLTFLIQFFIFFIICFEGTKAAYYTLVPLETLCALLCIVINGLIWFFQIEVLSPSELRPYFNFSALVIGIINIALYIMNLFTGYFFSMGENGFLIYRVTTLEALPVVLFFVVYLASVLCSKEPMKKKVIFASYTFFFLLFMVLNYFFWVMNIGVFCESISYTCLLLSQYLVFFCVSVEERESLLLQKGAAVEKDKLLLQQEKEYGELQTKIMLSQIQPHFLYNALTAIRSLCKTDPEKAYDALARFSDYLRMNMNSIGISKLVPFTKELEHTQTYLAIEQMRFGDELKVQVSLDTVDFYLPPLTLQPLVENAVRHGICKNEDGGTVRVSTMEQEGKIIIQVMDDGPGFDADQYAVRDDRNHIGLENVRKRVSSLLGGELTIESCPGKTTISVIFPVEMSGRKTRE